MKRSSLVALSGFAGLALFLAAPDPQAAAPAARTGHESPNHPMESSRPTEDRPGLVASEVLQRGIHTYGVGAAQVDRAPRPREGGSGEAALTGQPSTLAVTRKISGTPMAGSVTAFRVSPDGTTAVFIADKDTLGRFELFSAPASGAVAPIKISAGLVFGTGDAGVSAFQISPDSARVVFLADPDTGGGVSEIFSAPINGSVAPVKLNAAGVAPVTGFGITRDSSRAIFFGVDTSFASGAVELYRATIGSAASAVQISNVGQGNSLGDVVAAVFSPDSSRVVYAGDGASDNVFQWYSVSTAAAGPGAQVQLSAAIGSVGLARISPDSSRVVYTSDDNVLGRMEVFSKPVAGGTRVQLNSAMAGDGATDIEISPDSSRVVYLADQNTAGVNEVYSAQILVAGSGTRLNTPMSGTQYTDSMNISPDSTTVVYEADQATAGTYELFRAPINASAGPTLLHDLTAPASVGYFQGLGTPILGGRAVYPVFGAAVDLFSVPFNGSAPFIQVNDPLAAGESLFSVFLPFTAYRLMAYGLGPSAGTVTGKVIAAPIRSDLPPEQINLTAGAGARGVLGYEISADEKYGVYLQDQETLGKPELFSRELDSDVDSVVNAADNCPFIANPGQQPVIFGATVAAVDATTFTWGVPFDVRFVRGPLSSVATFGTNLTGRLIEATGHIEPANPALASGWYYLFAPDCAGRSYQSTLGAEPARDLAPLP